MNSTDSEMPDDKVKAIRIDETLYEQLRAFCDRQSLRFRDFAESALEEAIASETRAMLLERDIAKLKQKAVKYDYAYNRGFQQGFSFCYFMLNGLNPFDSDEEGLEIVRRFPAVAPKGDQLSLF